MEKSEGKERGKSNNGKCEIRTTLTEERRVQGKIRERG